MLRIVRQRAVASVHGFSDHCRMFTGSRSCTSHLEDKVGDKKRTIRQARKHSTYPDPRSLKAESLGETSLAVQANENLQILMKQQEDGLANFTFGLKKGKGKAKQQDQFSLVPLDQLTHHEQMCQAVANDTLQRPKETLHRGEEVSVLSECRDILFGHECSTPYNVEAIASRLAMAFLQVGSEAEALYTFEQVNRFLKTFGLAPSIAFWKEIILKAPSDHAARLTRQIMVAAEGVDGTDVWSQLASLHTDLEKLEELGQSKVPETLESFWKQFESKNLTPPAEVFSILVASQSRRGRMDLVARTIEAQKRHFVDDQAMLIKNIAHIHPKGRRVGADLGILDKDASTQQRILQELLVTYVKQDDIRNFVRVLRLFGYRPGTSIQTSTVPLSFGLVRTLALAFCERGQIQYAIRIFDLALQTGMKGDPTQLFIAINLAARRHGQAQLAVDFGLRLLGVKEGKKGGSARHLHPNRSILATIIHTAGDLEDSGKAVDTTRTVLLNMFQRSKKPNRFIYRALSLLLRKIMRHAKWHDVSLFFRQLSQTSSESDEIHQEQLSKFIKSFERFGHIDELFLRTAQKTFIKDFSNENHAWVTETRLEPSSPQPSRIFPYDEQNHLTYHSQPQNIPAVVHEMDMDKPLTARAYGLRLRVYGIIRRDYESARAIYESMLRHGIQPNMYHALALVESLVLNDRMVEAILVRDEALRQLDKWTSPEATRKVFIAIFRGFARRGDWNSIRIELRHMLQSNVEPDILLWAIVQNARHHHEQRRPPGRGRPIPEAKAVLASLHEKLKDVNPSNSIDEILSVKPYPKVETITILLRALTQRYRFIEAQDMVHKALLQGMRPDARFWIVLKSTERFLKREAKFSGYEPQALLHALLGHVSENSQLFREVHSPELLGDRYPLKAGRWSAKQRRRIAGGPRHPRELAYALFLTQSNLQVAARKRDELSREKRKAKRSRRKAALLMFDAIGSNRLHQEAVNALSSKSS